MHELSITRNVVAICAEQARGKVTRVTLEIGKLSAVLPEAVRFCFDVCAKGTPIEGARLEIIETPGRGRCRDCGGEVAADATVRSLRLRQRRSRADWRRRAEDQGNGGGVMCATCGCSTGTRRCVYTQMRRVKSTSSCQRRRSAYRLSRTAGSCHAHAPRGTRSHAHHAEPDQARCHASAHGTTVALEREILAKNQRSPSATAAGSPSAASWR